MSAEWELLVLDGVRMAEEEQVGKMRMPDARLYEGNLGRRRRLGPPSNNRILC